MSIKEKKRMAILYIEDRIKREGLKISPTLWRVADEVSKDLSLPYDEACKILEEFVYQKMKEVFENIKGHKNK